MNKVKQFNRKEVRLISDAPTGAKNIYKIFGENFGKHDLKIRAWATKSISRLKELYGYLYLRRLSPFEKKL